MYNPLTTTLGDRNYYLNFKEENQTHVFLIHTYAHVFLQQGFPKYATQLDAQVQSIDQSANSC